MPHVLGTAGPAWAEHVALYRRWWEVSVSTHAAAGETLSVTPEFGPPPYMHAEPFTGQPSGDIAAANGWMRERLEEWFPKEQQQ